MKQYLVVTIDTECDKSPTWHNSNPLTFKSIIEGVPELLTPLFILRILIFSLLIVRF